MARISEQVEWLSLIERSGPFVVPAVLEEIYPQGLEKIETPRRQRLRAAYDEWRDAVDEDDPDVLKLHEVWIRMVIQEALEYEDEILVPRERLDGKIVYHAPEHGAEITPDFAVRADGGEVRLLIAVYPPGTDLEKSLRGDRWTASPTERMTLLCRASGVRVGLVTNGEEWMLVNAPVGSTSGQASWFARLWWLEPVTFKAFVSLLGVRRCFGPADESLDQLLERSIAFQEEVTDTLGEQVRRAVEVLIQALGRADQDRNGELLKDVRPAELYEAGLTVMMRLVFILCAEERGLLLLGDPVYDQHYAISTLRSGLREDESHHGPEVLERRHDAWTRMLAVFRAVYGGVEHETLRMPALGGSLFDPDRFPFLEGRTKGTSWREEPAFPLPIDNRTVLLLLTALQVLEQRGGAQLLSYRALDVEQIGHVYEGLLEYTVAELPETTVGLIGSQKIRHPSITLDELESFHARDIESAAKHLVDITGRSKAAITNSLKRGGDDAALIALIHACSGDEALARRLLPFAELMRTDSWGSLLIYRVGSFAVIPGPQRRETGTHYTPRSLTESIVEKTLVPIVYTGPAEGKTREEWKLKTPAELLDLKICDPAMGSGAFLVQVCRYLAERLVEAWIREEDAGRVVTIDGVVLDKTDGEEPLSENLDDRLLIAKRLVAERCIYGVDLNPLAVELAKLSIWLVTLAKGRPFGFLDHNLRCGDSLLGIHRLEQLTKLRFDSDNGPYQQRIFGQSIKKVVEEAIELRKRLREVPIRDIRDVEAMAHLNEESRKVLQGSSLVADAFMGEVFRSSRKSSSLESAIDLIAIKADRLFAEDNEAEKDLVNLAKSAFAADIPAGHTTRRPFHWPLEFAEVFSRKNSGFDGIVGNPPFMFGKNVTINMGEIYNRHLIRLNPEANKNVDLCAHFFVRAFSLIGEKRSFAMLATSSISEGITAKASLGMLADAGGSIYNAVTKIKWPGKAAVYIAMVAIFKGVWQGAKSLDGSLTKTISPLLTEEDTWKLSPLRANDGMAFVGVIPNGSGLFLNEEDFFSLVRADDKNREVLYPYITGEDLNSAPNRPKRYIINFWDWPISHAQKYEAVFKIVEEKVKPHRQMLSDSKKRAKKNWWLYEASAKNLFRAIGLGEHFIKKPKGKSTSISRTIVIARISKTAAFVLAPTDTVYAAEVVVIASDDYALFSVLQSSVHLVFAWNRAGKMKTDLRYSPTLCFTPFPFPRLSAALRAIGKEFYIARQNFLVTRHIGLTELYGRIHDANCDSEDLSYLRALNRKLDRQVLEAYGWEDIDLNHNFHQVRYLPANDRVRYTISEPARLEILRRLSALNRKRYESEKA